MWYTSKFAQSLFIHTVGHSSKPKNWLGFLKAASKRKHRSPVNIVKRDKTYLTAPINTSIVKGQDETSSCFVILVRLIFFASKYCRHRKRPFKNPVTAVIPVGEGGGGYSHTLRIRVCAAQRGGRDFEALGLERGIHFRGVF